MTEALTNTLKHSNADLFRVELANKNKLLRVEFSDNGRQHRATTKGTVTQNGRWHHAKTEGAATQSRDSNRHPDDTDGMETGAAFGFEVGLERGGTSEKAAQGIGLAGIEERCALCYGRCFFEKRKDGFHITMTFSLHSA
jgi:signal transduction histidine kinase